MILLNELTFFYLYLFLINYRKAWRSSPSSKWYDYKYILFYVIKVYSIISTKNPVGTSQDNLPSTEKTDNTFYYSHLTAIHACPGYDITQQNLALIISIFSKHPFVITLCFNFFWKFKLHCCLLLFVTSLSFVTQVINLMANQQFSK